MDRARDPDLAAQLFGATPERTFVLVRAAWLASVGPELARRTEVVSVDRGVLQVRVPDATWRRSLWRMRGDILRRLRQVAGRLAPQSDQLRRRTAVDRAGRQRDTAARHTARTCRRAARFAGRRRS